LLTSAYQSTPTLSTKLSNIHSTLLFLLLGLSTPMVTKTATRKNFFFP